MDYDDDKGIGLNSPQIADQGGRLPDRKTDDSKCNRGVRNRASAERMMAATGPKCYIAGACLTGFSSFPARFG